MEFTGLDEVVIREPYAVNGLRKEVAYLLRLDADRLLYLFEKNAALPPKATASYGGGWEGSRIGGHFTGHYLSALAQASVNAGVRAEDRRKLREKLCALVERLRACQKHSQGRPGFLWGASPVEGGVEAQFDNVEAGKADIVTEAWVPWYTLHKILQGLIDAYTLAGDETALTAAKALGDWVCARTQTWDEATRARVLCVEYGGMNDCLYNLYAVTGEEKYAIAAHRFDEETLFDTVLAAPKNYLDGVHANTTIPKIIGALNRYVTCHGKTVGGEKADAARYLEVAEAFWQCVVAHHTYVTGGNSEWEHFGADDILDAERTATNCETCNTYNMLKLSRMLFALTKDKKYSDYYERTYYNAIWSSQNPETGMTTYFQPMATGYFKVYSSAEHNFWCCTGTGMESFTKLNDSIYYREGNAVYVTMYLDSTYVTDAFALRQTAALETSDEATISVERGTVTLYLRVPDWSRTFTVTRNGDGIDATPRDGFVAVDAGAGDEIRVTLCKKVTAVSLPDGENVYAFLYGPFALSASLGTADMVESTTGVNVTVPVSNAGAPQSVTLTGGTLADFMAHIDTHLVRAQDGAFILRGVEEQLVYGYHFRKYKERYGLYFTFREKDARKE